MTRNDRPGEQEKLIGSGGRYFASTEDEISLRNKSLARSVRQTEISTNPELRNTSTAFLSETPGSSV